jgi:spore photoproduct lyase
MALWVAARLLDTKRIYHEPNIERFPRTQQVLDRFPDAERIEVLSQQAIPGLYGNEGNIEDLVRGSASCRGTSRLIDIRTSKIADRIAALDDFVEAGYEVHLNFSPVIVQEDSLAAWAELLEQVADGTNERTKQQLAAEIIFLTHNQGLHEVNLGWHPKGEDLLWRPDLQQAKRSESGQWNVRYKNKSPWKGRWVQQLTDLVAEKLPTCRVR